MKKILWICLFNCVIAYEGTAQISYDLSFSIGNNGQLQKTFDDFYLGYIRSTSQSDYFYFGTNEIKEIRYSVGAAINFSKKYKLQLNYSTGQFKKSATESTNSHTKEIITEDYSQKINEWSISFSRLISTDKFTFCLGIDIPYIKIDSFYYSSENKPAYMLINFYNGAQNMPILLNETQTIPGGNVFGINTKIGIQYNAFKWLYVFVAGKFGLLKAELGGEADYSYLYAGASPLYTYSGNGHWVNVTKYQNTFVAPPVMELGIGFTFGKSGTEQK